MKKINQILKKKYGSKRRNNKKNRLIMLKIYNDLSLKFDDAEMTNKISILVMMKIEINLIQKKLLNHLKNYVIN